MKSTSRLYFNILPEKEIKDDDDYMWGRLQLN